MTDDFIAEVSIDIDASPSRVWEALVDPALIEQYMFGAEVTSDWEPGASIRWRGEWEGKAFEDKGTILAIEPRRLLRYSHYSPLSGAPDRPESYHTVSIELSGDEGRTTVTLSQDNNPTAEARDHSRDNWQAMLEKMKVLVESSG